MLKKSLLFISFILNINILYSQPYNYYRHNNKIYLDSKEIHQGHASWQMIRADEIKEPAEKISQAGYSTTTWLPAVVPGTVLNSLVYNNVYPDPYYGMNNHLTKGCIPDLAHTGRDFYTYWFRTEFDLPENYKEKVIWLQVDGINYRAEIWVNGFLVGNMAGMFKEDYINITDFVHHNKKNGLAIKVYPVDMSGTIKPKGWGATNEFRNGGDGNIGLNTTMLMSVGWDFTFNDGIRDRNTGIWKSISLYATDRVILRHPFIKSELNTPHYDIAKESVSVEVNNTTLGNIKCTINGEIVGENISFSKEVTLLRGETREIQFTPEEYPQLIIKNPRLWWPLFKGKQELYELKLSVSIDGKISDETKTRFGIREIISDQNTPDNSRQFYVNGKKIFIRGTNWIPEAMLRHSDKRTYAELRYTQQSGINLIRMWGGGIAESDYFFQLCDEMGLLVWQEFWMTADTKHPHDKNLYLANVEATVKRLRNHPSLAYYVSSNESTEMPETKELIMKLDGTRGYQMQSECDGIHDGSPYKQVNPMQHYENTASARGSRVDGFNPEYGAPTLPTLETLREIMDEKDLWPINKEVWDYHDGNGFHLMTTLYKDLIDQYGKSKTLDEFVKKGQLVGAMNSKSIWEVWNYNKYHYGDRYASGLLFWYHNCPVKQVCARMWDHSLEPTASLYHTQNALEPLHAQFDYLKNSVSVYNEYYRSFKNYKVSAEVYDLNSKKVWQKSRQIDIPEDGVVNDIFTINFPANITPVHFIKLRLYDEQGKEIANTFYWRSNSKYAGKTTLTGPTTAGFKPLSKLKQTELKTTYQSHQDGKNHFIEMTIKNTGTSLAFFTQIQLLDKNQKPVRPSFYTDNFFSLLPGESKVVTIETAMEDMPETATLIVKGWNVKPEQFHITPHLFSNISELDQVIKDFKNKQQQLPYGNLFSIFSHKLNTEEKEALMFLYAYMPIGDITDYSGDYYLSNVKYSLRARKEMPWGKSIPEQLFRHFVLPIRVNNENLDESRQIFYEELKERVKNLSLYEAVLEVNHWCHEKAIYTPSDSRTSSPLATVKTAYGRCGEESTFLVAALRAVGIPARQVYTPRWAHTDDNHAWVEAWVDGSWYFLGACEPEPVLNLGWFNAPASRGMLMHTKVFGRYNGPEEVMSRTAGYTEINIIHNYAPAVEATVIVQSPNHQPIEGAQVDFKIYNYAEFYTVASKKTDQHGKVTLSAGKGDMLIWATDGKQFGYQKFSFATDTILILTLDKQKGEEKSVDIDIIPPKEQAITPIVTAEQRADNNRRIQHEDSIRTTYTATFITLEKGKQIAQKLGMDETTFANILVKSRGNHKEIIHFIESTPPQLRVQALELLKTISEKDLRDTPATVLLDHLQNTPVSKNPLSTKYILNPRIAYEMLTPYKLFFQKAIDSTWAKKIKEQPEQWTQWCIDHITIKDSLNPQRIPIMPTGVWKSRVADQHSRDIFYVAVLRSLGIAARIEAVTGKTQYANKQGEWQDVHFTKTQKENNPQGKLQAIYNPVKSLSNPVYYTHFSISKYDNNGKFQLLTFPEEKSSNWENLLKQPMDLDVGYYMLVTGTRLANGGVRSHLRFFNIEKGETTTDELLMRENPDEIKVIGNFNSEALFLPQGKEKPQSILQTTGRGYFIVGILGANQEPSNHAIRDIATLKSEFEDWGRSMILLFSKEDELKNFNPQEFPALPNTITWGIDSNQEILKMIQENIELKEAQLPIFIIADTFNRVVFISQGYTIGLGEQLIRTIHALKQ